jgi:nucleotide-binding universal stress UspA family protein
MLPIRTVLHPTDFSPGSHLAFRLACSLARDYEARLVILHVAAPPVTIGTEGVVVFPPENYLDPVQKQLAEVKPRGSQEGVEHQLVEGDPAAEILRAARELPADVIVMGTHGRTGLSRLLMGSVAEAVVRKAPCPVLTAKSPVTAHPSIEESEPECAEEPVGAAHE